MKTHGKWSTYNSGCRCELCAAAARHASRAKTVRRAARLTGAEVPPEFAANANRGRPPLKPGDETERVVGSHLGSPVLHHLPVGAIGAVAGEKLVVEYAEHSILIRRLKDFT